MMTKDEFFQSLLTNPKHCVMCIPEINDYHEKDADADANIVLWLACNLNRHVKTKAQFARAHFVITQYASLILESNAYYTAEGEDNDELRIAYEGYDIDPRKDDLEIAKDEFPDCDFRTSEGDI
jgi:hypothetical protein